MASENQSHSTILVVEDVEETRCLLETMLTGNGYVVDLASNERDAISRARALPPDLILMSLSFEPEQLVATARRISEQAPVGEDVAVVIFCVPTIPEGAELEVHKNIYVTRPDNFNQLRHFLCTLLGKRSDC